MMRSSQDVVLAVSIQGCLEVVMVVGKSKG